MAVLSLVMGLALAAPGETDCVQALTPTFTDFQGEYPHNIENLREHQTLVVLDGAEYMVSGYDAESGTVSLLRNAILSGKQKATVAGMVITKEITAKAPGSFLREDAQGALEFLHYNAHGSKIAFFRHYQTRQIPLSVFRTLPIRLLNAGIQWSPPPTWRSHWHHPNEFEGRTIPLLGLERVRCVNRRDALHTYNMTSENDYDDERIDAERPSYIYTYELTGQDQRKHTIEVAVPRLPSITDEKYWADYIPKLLASTPLAFFNVAQEIQLVPDHKTSRHAGQAQLQNSKRTIRLWSNALPRSGFSTVYWHEVGHLAALTLWNDYTPRSDWLLAISRDHTAVTAYAQKNLAEDFAETFEEYLEADGGRLTEGFRQNYSNRADILDRLFGVTAPIAHAPSLRIGQRLFMGSVAATTLSTVAFVGWSFWSLIDGPSERFHTAALLRHEAVETPLTEEECSALHSDHHSHSCVVRCYPEDGVCGTVLLNSGEIVDTWRPHNENIATEAEALTLEAYRRRVAAAQP